VGERGGATVLMAGVLGLAALCAVLVSGVGGAAAARARAQAAADASALAAAQELVRPSGASVEAVAADYAGRNGARLVWCRCDRPDEVVVRVEVEAAIGLGPSRAVAAEARAVVRSPPGGQGLQPAFAAALSCLFGRVPGLFIVSGFRTHQEQARLHASRPDLAAPPGRSKHEVGLAADLGFPSPGARARAHAEAPACGLAFPVAHEPWHIEPT